MRGRDRITRSFERGILILVFVLLLLQTCLFVRASLGGTTEAVGFPLQDRFVERRDTLFAFDPNYVTTQELVWLGLSPKQAQVIINWREKGGYFWEKQDFARMYTVSDSLYERLEPYLYIHVPQHKKLNLNQADSAALDALPGIGPYFARKILDYRDRLGGYAAVEQLLEVGLDSLRWRSLSVRLWCDTTQIRCLSLSCSPADSLARHPYIGSYLTSSIVRWREFQKKPIKLEDLVNNGVISISKAKKLWIYCRP